MPETESTPPAQAARPTVGARPSPSRRLARLRARPLALLGLALVLLLLAPLAACGAGGAGGGSGGGSDDSAATSDADSASGSGGSSSSEAVEPAEDLGDGSLTQRDEAAAPEEAGDTGESGGRAAARTAPMERAVISTGQVSLASEDVGRDRAEVLGLVSGWGGLVSDEQSSADDDGKTSYTALTLRVPSGRFDDAMAKLAEVATVVDQSRTSEDVTTQVVDVDARIRAQERSVRRIEGLLAEAGSLRDVIAIESDLAGRQADLEALVAQQEALADQTSLATVTVTIDRVTDDAAPSDDGAGGFLGGLGAGWKALVASLSVVLTATGAVLPFAALLALLGVPGWLLVRRHRARTQGAVAPRNEVVDAV